MHGDPESTHTFGASHLIHSGHSSWARMAAALKPFLKLEMEIEFYLHTVSHVTRVDVRAVLLM